MILLFGFSDLNERQYIESWGDEDLRASVYASHVWNDIVILDLQAAEKMLKWAKTVSKIVLVGIAT